MNKTFVTIFEKSENIHLVKDVGQIPYHMYKEFGYDATLVTYRNAKEYPYLQDEVKGLKIKFLPKIKLLSYSLSIIWFLLKYAKTIDVLHLHHHRNKTYLHIIIYKKLNPKGIAFLKSDIGYLSILEYDGFIPKKRPKFWLREKLFNHAKKYVDIIGVETLPSKTYIDRKYPELMEKCLYFHNGIDVSYLFDNVQPLPASHKKNYIITVGRIGAPEKNHEMVLQALGNINLKEWEVLFIGPIEKAFERKINDFYANNPLLKNQVHFTGAVYDRKKLFEFYTASKLFLMTSYAEGFNISLIEALVYNNYLITTNFSGAHDVIEQGKYGKIINTAEELNTCIQSFIDNPLLLDSYNATESVVKKYDWQHIVGILQHRIEVLSCT